MAKRKVFGSEEARTKMSGSFYQVSSGDKRESGRVKEMRRVLDPAARIRRQKKAVDGLEHDNFHDDPHANLVMHKKAPKFEETFEAKRKRRSKASLDYSILTSVDVYYSSRAKYLEGRQALR
ncbi:hypothetical protein HPB50_026864 [Hyalomma asiaticum]|uniref:Uncharacterized protein n=1 Tax=Hyalomma asiaticum TaxID=266040 RepID=A0ACB7S5M6_HYAAI|nr:hypothetical protein HPB50_026864 [Hyalomma asiaticum]